MIVSGLTLLFAVGCQSRQVASPAAVPTVAATSSPRLDQGVAHAVELSPQEITMTAKNAPLEGSDFDSNADDPDILAIRQFKPGTPKAVYSSNSFEPLLPVDSLEVGQTWEIPRGAIEPFLRQFHPSASEKLIIDGAGSYGVVRAVSDSFLDIRTRTHAQLEIKPDVMLFPAQFEGRLLINRASGKIESFSLVVPTDNKLNVDFEINHGKNIVGMVLAPELTLTSDTEPPAIQAWDEEISEAKAQDLLRQQFFAFEQLDWLPLDQAIKRAKETKKPVFSIVIAGVLNDQSC